MKWDFPDKVVAAVFYGKYDRMAPRGALELHERHRVVDLRCKHEPFWETPGSGIFEDWTNRVRLHLPSAWPRRNVAVASMMSVEKE